MVAPRPASISAFRALLRAQHKTFVGDKEMLERARIHSREQFLKNKDLTDDAEIERLRKEADNVSRVSLASARESSAYLLEAAFSNRRPPILF
mmetsp:Transcript_27729/g.108753  ORF Transcript_27729/g.108753 Transcript_27729/m.108753 type:complete len:93 (-) Transcript_27729:2414-2692(-)